MSLVICFLTFTAYNGDMFHKAAQLKMNDKLCKLVLKNKVSMLIVYQFFICSFFTCKLLTID